MAGVTITSSIVDHRHVMNDRRLVRHRLDVTSFLKALEESTLFESGLWSSSNGREHRCERHHDDQGKEHLREDYAHSKYLST